MLAEGNEKGAAMVQAAVDALVAQTRGIEAVVGGIGVEIKVEGSDSLDDPNKVIEENKSAGAAPASSPQ